MTALAMRRLAFASLASCLLAGCGSTVQVSSSQSVPADASGLNGLEPVSPGDAVRGTTSPTGSRTVGGGMPAPEGANAGDGELRAGGAGPAKTVSAGPRAPVEIGFLVTEDTGETTQALGYGGLSTGSGVRQAKVAASLLNARGGLAGHRVVPVIFEATVSGGSSQFQTACSQFFDDRSVRAVVSLLINDVLRGCTAKHGVPYVAGALDSTSAAILRSTPQLVIPNQTSYDQVSVTLVDSLVAQGWFRPSTPTERVEIGLITHEEPQFSTVPMIVRQRLKAAGLKLRDVAFLPYPADTDDIAAASNAGRAAALRFQSEGVNRVIGIDEGGFAMSWFGISAGSQNYYPTLALSTTSQPSVLAAGVLTSEQLKGSAGIGWAPYLDTSVALQAPVSRRTTECLEAMKKAGEDVSGASERTHSIGVCEGAFTLLDAWRSVPLTLSGFQRGLSALGSSYVPVSVFGADFSRSRAAAAKYRRFRYASDCDCYRYTGAFLRIGA
jgi:hypothetical protein